MYTLQAPSIHNALAQGGVAPAQASQIQNLFGQCRQPLEHRGPVKIDYTSPDMRLITPETARQRFPDLRLNPPEGLGKRPNGPRPPEEKPRPEPPRRPLDPNPNPGPEPEGPGGRPVIDYKGGKYIEVKDKTISLIVKDARRHAIFSDDRKTVESVTFTSKSDDEQVLFLEIDEQNRDTQFSLKFRAEQITYIKSIRLDVDNEKIYIERGAGYVFNPQDLAPQEIPLVVCDTESSGTP